MPSFSQQEERRLPGAVRAEESESSGLPLERTAPEPPDLASVALSDLLDGEALCYAAGALPKAVVQSP